MESNVHLPLDHLGEASRGPEFGSEAMLRGAVGQPAAYDLLLGRGQLGWASGGRPRGQPGVAVLAKGPDPTAHTAGINPEELSDLSRRVSLQDTLNSEETP